jgi:hypothetical protein
MPDPSDDAHEALQAVITALQELSEEERVLVLDTVRVYFEIKS